MQTGQTSPLHPVQNTPRDQQHSTSFDLLPFLFPLEQRHVQKNRYTCKCSTYDSQAKCFKPGKHLLTGCLSHCLNSQHDHHPHKKNNKRQLEHTILNLALQFVKHPINRTLVITGNRLAMLGSRTAASAEPTPGTNTTMMTSIEKTGLHI